MQARLFRTLSTAPALFVALILASCGPGRNEFPPDCPTPEVLKPLSTLNRYRATWGDARELIISGRIVDIAGKCEWGDNRNTVVVNAQVVMDLTRGPAMDGRTYAVPLFVAVTDAEAIRDKGQYAVSITFPPNVDTTRALSQTVRMELPVTLQKSAAAYGIVTGFQLLPEEVAASRQSNRR